MDDAIALPLANPVNDWKTRELLMAIYTLNFIAN